MTTLHMSWLPAVAAVLLAAAPAPAQQSESETGREIERLRARVRELELELSTARRQVAELEGQVERLGKLLEAAGVSSPAPPATQPAPQEGVDESVPNASPRALVAALKESYREATADLPMGQPGDRERVAFLRALEKWTSRVNRELKSQVLWHVRVASAPWHDERNPRLELVAVDPKSGAELGAPFPAQAPRTALRRIEQLEQRGELAVLRLKGVVLPNVRVNPYRDSAGVFDKPRFIGPLAECELTVVVASLSLPHDEEEPEQEPLRRRRS